MNMPRDSVARAIRAQGVGLALFLALGVAAAPLAAQARAQGGHSDGSAGEAPHARSEPGGDRGSWNHGGGSGGSSGGGTSASPSGGSGSSGSGNDGSSAQPRSNSPGGGRGEWHDRGNRGGGDRGHHGGGHGGGHYGYGYRYPYYTNLWWGWWGWGWGWGDYPYGYGGGYGRGYGNGDDQGALDLDIWPGDTQVWLDGQYIGTVDDFDGFPTYLWLEKGTYDLAFYRDGYQTLARQYSIYPGLTVDVGDRLVPGPSVRPEDLPTKTHVRRDTRIDDEHQRSERIDRDRGRYDDHSRDSRDSDDGRAIAPSGDEEQGRLMLSIEPDDASVYLDGKFIGTAEEIGRLHRGLVVDAGQHRISVVRPGRRGAEQTVTVRPGAEQEIEIELESSGE